MNLEQKVLIKRFGAKNANGPTPTYPRQLIFFRDGVSESQFEMCMKAEIPQIERACEDLGIQPKVNFPTHNQKEKTWVRKG
jgi:hypothetical protein